MVLLKKLHSPTGLIDDIEFQKGINIIKGEYTGDKRKKDLNGIGKSTLVRMIDFMLLSRSGSQDYFNTERNDIFKDHRLRLDFESDGEIYHIERLMNEPNEPRFGKNPQLLEEYDTAKDLKRVLFDIFYDDQAYPGIIEREWFRKLSKFFVKDDLEENQRTNPVKYVSTHESKLDAFKYNLFLLGIPNEGLVTYKNLKDRKKDLRKDKNKLEKRVTDETGMRIDQVRDKLRRHERKIKQLEDSLDDYNLSENYEDIEKDIVKLSNRISDHLKEIQKLENRLNEIKRSYKRDSEIDVERIEEIYSEVDERLSMEVKKSLDEVIGMRRKLASNRKQFLKEKEEDIQRKLEERKDKLSELEEKRSKLYEYLDQKEALDSVKDTYTQLIDEKKVHNRLETLMEEIEVIEDEIYEIEEEMSEANTLIREEIKESNDKVDRLSSLFTEMVQKFIHVENSENILFNIKAQPNNQSPLKITVDVPKSNALGKKKLKMLSYDLTVFFNIITEDRPLPRFLVHDGVFHGIDQKTVVRVLNHVESFHRRHRDFQYIFTGNEDELAVSEEMGGIYDDYIFDQSEKTIVTLKDEPSEMLLGTHYETP